MLAPASSTKDRANAEEPRSAAHTSAWSMEFCVLDHDCAALGAKCLAAVAKSTHHVELGGCGQAGFNEPGSSAKLAVLGSNSNWCIATLS